MKTSQVMDIALEGCQWVRREVFCHHEANGSNVVTLPKMTDEVSELLSSAHAKEKASN